MNAGDLSALLVLLLVLGAFWRQAERMNREPRRLVPKPPRDRSQDWQIVPWIGFRF